MKTNHAAGTSAWKEGTEQQDKISGNSEWHWRTAVGLHSVFLIIEEPEGIKGKTK